MNKHKMIRKIRSALFVRRSKHQCLLRAVNGAASVLLAVDKDNFENALHKGMELIAKCMDVDRIYIWRNEVKDGFLYYIPQFEWLNNNGNEGLTISIEKGFSYSESIPEWEDTFSNEGCVNGPLRCQSPAVYERLSPYGICSILVIPVHLKERFWGFVSFDDCHLERFFSEDEVSILRSCSLLLVNAILQNELTHSLRIAADEALAASLAKSKFLSNMSHEMRTPLNAITGMSMVGRSALDLKKKNYAFDKIDEASNHLLGVINDILDMSKIEADKLELSEVEFNFKKLLHKAINSISFRISEKCQHITIHIDKNIPETLIGDDIRLTQIITNLLSNAVKFTPEQGFVWLEAYLDKEEEDICTLRIKVSDTGIGISKQQQERLFKPFEQAESSISRKYGGTGLGLSISKRIIEKMGGNISIESSLGVGTTFTFTIQQKKVAVKDKTITALNIGDASLEHTAKDESTDCLSGYHVLLAEDMDINREIVLSILEPTQLRIDCAKNGAETLEMFCAAPESYDLILMDIQMPHMDGLEATRRIRALGFKKAKEIPIIAMTANVFKEDIEKCIETGMNDHIGKPLDFDIVMKKIKLYLHGIISRDVKSNIS